MVLSTHYREPSQEPWQGRKDAPANTYFFQMVQLLNLTQTMPKIDRPAFVLIGFICDEGIRRNHGRVGAAEGPNAIRKCLGPLPFHRQNIECYDAGNITCVDEDLERAQTALSDVIAQLLENKFIPIVLGGGHELAWGHYQGIEKTLTHQQLGIINFDAHFDMRPLLAENKGSSGTPFLQIAKAHQSKTKRFDYNCIGIQTSSNMPQLFATANEYGAQFLLADDLQVGKNEKTIPFIQRIIKDNDVLYVSLCLDVFAAPFAPGVSAPQTFGLTPWQVLPLIRQLAKSNQVISYDIAELSPPFDIDQRTAKLAAQFIHEIIHHHATEDQG